MLFCKPKTGWPCLQYTGTNQDELNHYLKENGGNEARFDTDGKAHILTLTKGEQRSIYCNPGSWLRSFGPCQFSAMNDKTFQQLFEIV